MLKQLLLLTLLIIEQHTYAQNWTNTIQNIWQDLSEFNSARLKSNLNISTENIRLIQLDIKELKDASVRQLNTAISDNIKQLNTILQMPMPDGGWQQFQIMKLPAMHPKLAIKFPDINSYKGYEITDPSSIIYFDELKKGFYGIIYSGRKHTVFIDPVNSENKDIYKIYYKNDVQKNNDWFCNFSNDYLKGDKTKNNTLIKSNSCGLKTFRIAFACTGEYAQYHGSTKELALAAINTTLTRLNGIFERDFSVLLQLVSNNDLLVFLNPYVDPLPNNYEWESLVENQNICGELIGQGLPKPRYWNFLN